MPMKPKRPCAYPGCPNLTDGKYCERHKGCERPVLTSPRNPFYATKEWKELRARFIAEHPRCAMCGAKAEIVDHIVPIKDGGPMLDERNLQSLCRSCHGKKSILEGSRYRRMTYSY